MRDFLALCILACGLLSLMAGPARGSEEGASSSADDPTNVDGATSEGDPTRLPLAATVLGEEVRTRDAAEMQRIVLTRLFEDYAAERDIEASEPEIDSYVDQMRHGMRAAGLTAEDDLTAEESAQLEQMRRDMGRSMIRQWKLNRALYRQYGGRIIYQQLGPEPIDAYRQFLEDRRAAGDFTIHEASFEADFWRYFTDDSRHSFYERGSEEESQAFSIPPWERTPDAATPQTQQRPRAKPQESVGAAEGTGGPLAGTRWRLVRFQSMDDATGEIEPDDPSACTMTLEADGTVRMQLDCNSAVGTWKAEPAGDGASGSFTLGPLAATQAICPPASMDERIARDAEWVRGYLLRDGQLNLSLMAAGGIYTWAPASGTIVSAHFAAAPDPALEDALRAGLPDYTRESMGNSGNEGRYVYGRVDLNADGRDEVLALTMGSFFCGTGGCNLYLFSESGAGYSLIQHFVRSRLPVIASPEKTEKTAGWHDLIRRESGGGVPALRSGG